MPSIPNRPARRSPRAFAACVATAIVAGAGVAAADERSPDRFVSIDPYEPIARTTWRFTVPVGPLLGPLLVARIDYASQVPLEILGRRGGLFWAVPLVLGRENLGDAGSGRSYGSRGALTALEFGALLALGPADAWVLHASLVSPKLTNLDDGPYSYPGTQLATLTHLSRPADAALVMPGAFLRLGASTLRSGDGTFVRADLDLDVPLGGLTSVWAIARAQAGVGRRVGSWAFSVEASAIWYVGGAQSLAMAVAARNGGFWIGLGAPIDPGLWRVEWGSIALGFE